MGWDLKNLRSTTKAHRAECSQASSQKITQMGLCHRLRKCAASLCLLEKRLRLRQLQCAQQEAMIQQERAEFYGHGNHSQSR